MVDFAMADWVVVLVVLVALGVLVHLLIAPFLQRQLMRCPKNGAVTFVDAAPAPPGDSNAASVTVRNCDLWPGQKDCDQGCLERYSESTRGFRVDLHALRDFKRQ
ncbi:MAG: hypothetical protein OEV67_16250 [Betaproteobacteria bacterium]|jgi:hypothetical protein|nr:hypothetical protein [Betaproteobacteria bacterium]